MSSFSAFGKELYYGTLLFCSGRWEVCHLRSEDISLYIRCLLSALPPWRGRARADDFWMRLRSGMPDPERMTRVVDSWIAVQNAGLLSRLVDTRGSGQFTYSFTFLLSSSISY